MYRMNETGLSKLELYVSKKIAETIGIHEHTVGLIKKGEKLVGKQTAYCLTKFLNPEAEIEEFFVREDK